MLTVYQSRQEPNSPSPSPSASRSARPAPAPAPATKLNFSHEPSRPPISIDLPVCSTASTNAATSSSHVQSRLCSDSAGMTQSSSSA
jgi:hypothetical protein